MGSTSPALCREGCARARSCLCRTVVPGRRYETPNCSWTTALLSRGTTSQRTSFPSAAAAQVFPCPPSRAACRQPRRPTAQKSGAKSTVGGSLTGRGSVMPLRRSSTEWVRHLLKRTCKHCRRTSTSARTTTRRSPRLGSTAAAPTAGAAGYPHFKFSLRSSGVSLRHSTCFAPTVPVNGSTRVAQGGALRVRVGSVQQRSCRGRIVVFRVPRAAEWARRTRGRRGMRPTQDTTHQNSASSE
mmetsp:Transcript_8388/g.23839  ORF Transcript_8388/g.23839 Transcript_8388/m.23839 type:complete len:242 (+) Transcript_8388:947-1672(+)